MLSVDIEIPNPSRFVSDAEIDEIALAYCHADRAKNQGKTTFLLDLERFVDRLEVSILWEEIVEPEGAFFLASYAHDNGGLITINERHRLLFDERPDIYAACIGHEIGHRILRHHEHSTFDNEQPSLFSESTKAPYIFHKSSWDQYGLTKDEVIKRKEMMQELAKNALISEKARQLLSQMQNRFEPEWMFWQAEQFALCLQVPKDRLLEILEDGWDYTNWRGIYQLGERFGISGSMMRRRLVKLKLIKIGEDGKPYVIQQSNQQHFFS